jgi:hypothetical protein
MFEAGLKLIGGFMVKQLQLVLDKQGHRASGNLIDTMRSEVKSSGNGFTITIFGANYAQAVAQGVPPGTKVSTKALAEWVETKGIATGETAIKSLAFAIQRKIFKEGTIQFRENKEGFVDVMLDENAKTIFKMVLDLFQEEITLSLRDTIAKNKRIFQK